MSPASSKSLLTEVEENLKKSFNKDKVKSPVPSTAQGSAGSARLDQLVLPVAERGRMPLTKDKYVIKENPHLVAWERETRRFLRNLTPRHGHRVSAVMIYEWATGILVKDMIAAGQSPQADLRKINQVLRHYFGKPYMTYIAGRKVTNAYRVRQGYLIKRHRPLTIVLWVEYREGTLNP